jgi:FAD/FMN-containing dehydrogenase
VSVIDQFLDQLLQILGPAGCVTDPALLDSYITDWRGIYHGQAMCVLRPSRTEELAAVMAVCAKAGIAVVPQGGNTSLTGAATPDGSGHQVIVSLNRLKRIRAVDIIDMTVTVEAGLSIAELQSAAIAAGALFPLSFAAEGSATVGGAIATNAGGTAAVRYGSARDLLLGLEVVLPDGAIWNGLRRLHKDNAGYALRHLFAGSEGTLGVITAAVLRLFPAVHAREVAFCSLGSEQDVLALWRRLREREGGSVRAVEYMSGDSIAIVLRHGGLRLPVGVADHYMLIELNASQPDAPLRERLESVLAEALEAGEVIDAAVAQNGQQRDDFWRLRESQTEAQKQAGGNLKHDISVPVSNLAELLRRCRAELKAWFDGVRIAPFGHVGDGNIHMNIIQPDGMSDSDFLACADDIGAVIYDVVESLGGSFSAEHGIGRSKLALFEQRRPAAELDLMRRIKAAIDPGAIMNPGKVLRMPPT